MSNGGLPNYLKMAKPNPATNRAPWYKNTAQTYAGIMLWFVFWNEVPVGRSLQPGTPYSGFAGGILSQGLGVAILGVILAALICHFLFYVVPGMLGMKSGLPLYIVGTSTYGAQGGFLMPGFLMGVLQFGWLAVNAFFAGVLLCAPFGQGPGTAAHAIVATLWAVGAAFMGVKGIQYVAKVATFLPLIPLAILIILVVSTIGGIGDFDSQALIDRTAAVEVQQEVTLADGATETQTIRAAAPLSTFGVVALVLTYIVGFFATAGAAGADFGMNNRDARDVQLGGLVGIAGSTILAGGAALLIVAGAHGAGKASDGAAMAATSLMGDVMGSTRIGGVFMYLLAIAAFPPACFSSFIAANSFKTTLPNVKPMISCGIGTLVAVILAVTGLAGNAVGVFNIIGASFGPICGAMMVDYLLSGRKWAGPRAGVNWAGWISWLVGFIVGMAPMVGLAQIPAAPVAAFIVGAVLYFALAKAGLEPQVVPLEPAPVAQEPQAAAAPPPVAEPTPPAEGK